MIQPEKNPEYGGEEGAFQETPAEDKPKPKIWMALIPGLLTVVLTAGFAIPKWFQFGRVAGVITDGGVDRSSSGTATLDLTRCVDVYAVTMKTSEFYVPELRAGSLTRKKNAPRDLSTVVEGMANNRCGKPLKRVRIRMNVRDDQGRRGNGWAEVGDLANGQAKSFERAWMARVTSYEIVEIQ